MKMSEFLKLLNSTPTVKDLYFVGKGYGGYSPCLVIDLANGFVLPNCCGYVWGIWLEASGLKNLDLCGGNACNYYGFKDTYERSKSTPKVGAIACWKDNSLGHIGIVSKIYGDKSIDVRMSSYGGDVVYTRHITYPYSYYNANGKMSFQGFIYCPYVEPDPVSDNLKVGDNVQIIGTGAASIYGGRTAYGIGWKRKIKKIYAGADYPYQVGNAFGTTGFYKASALKKV